MMRQATRFDVMPLWNIFQTIIEVGDTYVQDVQTTLVDFETYWFGRGGEQWVMVQGDPGTVVGGFTLRPNQVGRGSHVATASYIVSSEVRGKGIGHTLGQQSLTRARALGFRAIQFNFVVSTNTPAVRLWTSLGFEMVGRLPGAFLHRTHGYVDACVMYLSVEPKMTFS